MRIAVLLFFQITVKVKISKTEAAKFFIKQSDFFYVRIDNVNAKHWRPFAAKSIYPGPHPVKLNARNIRTIRNFFTPDSPHGSRLLWEDFEHTIWSIFPAHIDHVSGLLQNGIILVLCWDCPFYFLPFTGENTMKLYCGIFPLQVEDDLRTPEVYIMWSFT